MKTGRRTDSENMRRPPRDREAPVGGRFNKKRPSMLSEFQSHAKYYNHRDSERESGDVSHCRPHNRHGPHEPPSFTGGPPDYDRSHGFYKSKQTSSDFKRHHTHHHHRPHHHPHPHHNDADYSFDEETPVKRPRLSVDVSQRAPVAMETPNSADSLASSSFSYATLSNTAPITESPTTSPAQGAGGLSAYLEDIDSDDDDALLRDATEEEEEEEEEEDGVEGEVEGATTSKPRLPAVSAPPPPAPLPQADSAPPVVEQSRPSKEELLQLMEKVDRDISTTEAQILALQKKQTELDESGTKSSPSISPSPFQPSPLTPSPTTELTRDTNEGATPPSPISDRRTSPKRSLIDSIYSENKLKARAAQSALGGLNFPPLPAHFVTPLYHLPSETSGYGDVIDKHALLRPRLMKCMRRAKLTRHWREVQLCAEFDSHMADWDKRVERIESSAKKRARDLKSRELFERTFPELKAKREQQERLTRIDQRGISVVRSDAELKEIMYELYEQESAPMRYRRTHAVIPAMITDPTERRARFHSNNGSIADPMMLYRESRFANIWTDEEKETFRERYVMFPKNFDLIAQALPNKSPSDCVKYYYLSKKNENFKQLTRKANFKRKKDFIKSHGPVLHTSGPLPHSGPATPTLLPTSAKLKPSPLGPRPPTDTPTIPRVKSDYGEWSKEEIASLKEGLRKYGRAWGKVYREVGGRKTATQCKMFYDTFCSDKSLALQQALLEHTALKNAERLRHKSEGRKPVATVIAEAKKKSQQHHKGTGTSIAGAKASSSSSVAEDMDSENTESASESVSSGGEDSGSESTITDSGPEDAATPTSHPHRVTGHPRGVRKSSANLAPTSSSSRGSFKTTSEEALDLFISAAEALNNIVPPDIALHDHSYSLPASSLINSVDLQGTSGLSLIAAAAAVVSPSLARSAGSSKLPVLSPVRAPRGRPPNSQRRSSSSSLSKLSPTLLSPVGPSCSVLLTDMKAPTLRGRARSAPSDRPRTSTVHFPRPSSLARVSINSSNRSGPSGAAAAAAAASRSFVPPASYSKNKDPSSSSSPQSASLKSMVASQPQQVSGSGTSAFEALVNVAVAAHPAELPRTSSNTSTNSYPALTFQATSTPSSSSSASSPVVTAAKDSLASATTTAYIDVNQAINILAQLAQQSPTSGGATPSFSLIPLPQTSPAVLGSLVSQNGVSNSSSSSLTSESRTNTSSAAASSNGSTGGEVFFGQLTANKSANSSVPSQPTPSAMTLTTAARKRAVGGADSPASSRNGADESSSTPSSSSGGDELVNLNLLSSLVAVVAATQSNASSSLSSVNTPPSVSMATSSSSSAEQLTSSLSGSSTRSSFSRESIQSQHHIVNHVTSGDQVTPTSAVKREKGCPAPSSVSHSLATSELPRSVVRTSMAALAQHDNSANVKHESSQKTSTPLVPGSAPDDITASLASIIPTYPSISQQSSVFLYARSMSFPRSTPSSLDCGEEEDHLESATRSISELSKLLGSDAVSTDSVNSTDPPPTLYKGTVAWNTSDLLSAPSVSTTAADLRTSHYAELPSNSSEASVSGGGGGGFMKGDFISEKSSKQYLPGLMEGRGSVHHPTNSPVTLGNTNSNNSIADQCNHR